MAAVALDPDLWRFTPTQIHWLDDLDAYIETALSWQRAGAAIAFYKERGVANAIREIVIVQVRSAGPIDSPAYDLALTEVEVRRRWERYWRSVRAATTSSPPGE